MLSRCPSLRQLLLGLPALGLPFQLMKIGLQQVILQLSIVITNMASADLTKVAGVKDMATANTHFTFDLLRLCAADDKGQNVFFAPYSITTALAMTCLGARGNTAEEMKRVLKWSSGIPTSGFGTYLPLLDQSAAASAQTAGYVLVAAQRIYVRKSLSLKSDFSQATKEHFVSQAVAADFAGNADGERSKINSWVEEQTRNKIQGLLPPGSIDSLTGMVLVQAVYFKGNWKHKFDSKHTMPKDFFTPRGPVKVHMMQQTTQFRFGVSEDLKCQAVELPYAGSSSAPSHDLSMLVLLPDAQDGLEKLESALTHGALEKLQKEMRYVKVDLKLPRFTVESKLNLKQKLTGMGMPQAFTVDADFTAMADEDLSISDVFHKAVVEVDEEGSEAAAAAAVIGKVRMSRSPILIMTFDADHPFLFFIVDKRADVILFSGRLLTPPTMDGAGTPQGVRI